VAASSDTTQLPDVDLTVDYINYRCEELGLTLEQANRISAVVRVIRDTLRHGISKICAALAVPKTAQALPMIQPRHLQQVIEDPDLLASLLSPGSATQLALGDCREFLNALLEQVPEALMRDINLDYVTISDACRASGADQSLITVVINMATALGLTLADVKEDAFTEMRLTLADPPAINLDSDTLMVTSVMMHAALENWDMWHQLLDEHPKVVTFTAIRLTREFLTTLY
jgi:hypothetical protein